MSIDTTLLAQGPDKLTDVKYVLPVLLNSRMQPFIATLTSWLQPTGQRQDCSAILCKRYFGP